MLETALHVLVGMHVFYWSCLQRSNNSAWGMFLPDSL